MPKELAGRSAQGLRQIPLLSVTSPGPCVEPKLIGCLLKGPPFGLNGWKPLCTISRSITPAASPVPEERPADCKQSQSEPPRPLQAQHRQAGRYLHRGLTWAPGMFRQESVVNPLQVPPAWDRKPPQTSSATKIITTSLCISSCRDCQRGYQTLPKRVQ